MRNFARSNPQKFTWEIRKFSSIKRDKRCTSISYRGKFENQCHVFILMTQDWISFFFFFFYEKEIVRVCLYSLELFWENFENFWKFWWICKILDFTWNSIFFFFFYNFTNYFEQLFGNDWRKERFSSRFIEFCLK